MSQRSVKFTQTSIDPMFYIPDGVDELVYTDVPVDSPDEVDQDSTDIITTGEVDIDSIELSSADVDTEEVPETPQVLGVEEPQTIRMNDAGVEVVDAVLEVDDTSGVVQYEIRVVKV